MATKEQKVMIVDDNRDLADLYTTWLSDSYCVKTVYSGSEALNQLDETIDIVLLDRRMPELPGEEVLAEIQERDLSCCVALVTSVEPGFDILDLGFDAYLEKRVTRKDLHQLVDTLSNRLQYNESLQEYYALQSKQTALRAQKDQQELQAHPEFEALSEQINELELELQEVCEEFTASDYRALFREIA